MFHKTVSEPGRDDCAHPGQSSAERSSSPTGSRNAGSENAIPAVDVIAAKTEDTQDEAQSLFALDLTALGESGYLTPDKMRSRLAEQYRILKRPILKQAIASEDAGDSSSRIIAVTSAVPGEGKTFTVLNLAMSIAMERDLSVLVIDADLIERALTSRVQMDDRPGLSDILLDSGLEPGEVTVKVDVGQYAIIPAGSPAEHPSELVSSERMREVIQALAERHEDRIILIDTAPLLTTSQGVAISDLAGQVLVVVEEGKTSKQVVMDAVSIISHRASIGLVLNKSSRAAKASYWPYYGGV